jgi:hypothetical protein
VLSAGTVNLSIGGNSDTLTTVADGKSRYPASSDQIAAFSTGSVMNRRTQTAGQAKSAK